MTAAVPSMKDLIGKYSTGADAYAGTVNAVNGLNGGTTQDIFDAGINFTKVSLYFVELARQLPVAAQALNVGSLASNLIKANDQLKQRGYIESSLYAGIISDLAGIASLGALTFRKRGQVSILFI